MDGTRAGMSGSMLYECLRFSQFQNSRRIAPFRTKTRYLSLRSTLTPDVICWSRDARVTGTEDALTLVKRIDDASSSVWNIIRSLHREEGESEEAWKSRKAAVFQQLAPLIDRVGRLTADAAGVLKCIAEGGEIPAVPPEDGTTVRNG